MSPHAAPATAGDRPVAPHRCAARHAAAVAVLAAAAACGATAQATDGGGPDGTPGIDAVPPPDGIDAAPVCPDPPPSTCDYFLSCGCDTEGGQKCAAGPDGPHCVAGGFAPAGALCESDAECAAGTLCAEYAGAQICLPYCDATHSCPADPPQACYIRVNDDSANEIGKLCGQMCSLLDQDCAASGQGCYPSRAYAPVPDRGVCVTAGEGVQNTACASSNECAAGFVCITAGSGSVCAKICDRVDGEPPCAGILSCKYLNGHEQAGVCLPG